MEKVILVIVMCIGLVNASSMQKNCLQCHKEQKIPSQLIYKRYLLKYSTENRIKNALYSYLVKPDIKHSIMPSEFFLKFPIKSAIQIEDEELKENIEDYIKHFDLKKRLIIKK